jgi:DNA-directed RNA polymerase sigma subunit (sigma70/sigma32)
MGREILRGGQMSLEEIAEAEGISRGAVNMILQRAMRKLRRKGLVVKMQELADDLDRNRKGSVQYET